jgi:alkyl sulfatase BDS1-like metallo-beta-lactamase superfamily hydrolase
MFSAPEVAKEATIAVEAGERQWAAELLRHVVPIYPDDTDARNAKADTPRQIGYTTPNSNWRNRYLTAAGELDGTI